MITLDAAANGLQVRCQTISGLRVSDTWPNTITPPHAIVLVRPGVRATLGGDRKFPFLIKVLCQISDIDRAFDNIYLYMDATGTKSIIAALEGDETLGGIAHYVSTDEEEEGWTDFPGIEDVQTGNGVEHYIGADLKGSVWVGA